MSVLRPDEEASQSMIRRAGEREVNIKKGLKTGVGIASTLAGAGIASKVLPFLNEYIPSGIALKGISKVSPKLGDFLENGLKNGLDLQGGLDYLKNQLTPDAEVAKENRNIIEQYSPELHNFINEQVGQGRSAIEAGAIAQNDKRFMDVIKKLTKDHKTPWSNILQSVYGGVGEAQPQQPQQPQPGQGQQALMQMLQQINQRFGAQ